MRILVSNPSLQYTRNTVKALLKKEHVVYFATAYWYQPNRLFERIIALTPFINYLKRYADADIPDTSVLTNYWASFFHFLLKVLPVNVEQKSFWEDQLQDQWVAKFVKKWKPQLTIGYEKSCSLTFAELDKMNAVKWLDLSQVHPNFIDRLRKQFPFFKTITGTDKLFQQISANKKQEYQLADRIICLSDFAAKTVAASGIAPHKIKINPLGFNSAIFYPPVLADKKNSNTLHLIYAGIITQRKGIHILLNAMNKLSQYDIILTLIGPAGDATSLINNFSDKPNIRYIPFLSQNDLANEFRKADLFVFPSYLDSWAAVVVEAMACGLPVIVSDHTGASQLVAPNTGMVISTGDVQALVNAIEYFIVHPAKRIDMGKNAAEQCRLHSWSKYAGSLNAMVDQVAQSYNYV